ncbi:O-succinylhomoserine sulfhydrylase [gamma proteobacterium HIMB55]|nr:O-succinylhomoserine sulfhydrylase [gamma proteobacterium HIMB55]
MSDTPLSEAGFETLAIREGLIRGFEQEHSDPIYATSSFVFESAEQAAATFSGERDGNTYSRFSNPTVSVFEKRLAALEGGEDCVATSSGMSAILTLCLTVLKTGDHVVCSRNVFGSTVGLFNNILTKLGIDVSFVSLRDLSEWQAAVTPRTKLFFCETPSNPICEVGDIRQIATIASSANALLAVDNCFCTPALQKPLELGADVVMHSATKYLDGQGRVLGGALVGGAELMADVRAFVRVCGPSMSPFNAWVFSKGLETLQLRMDAHSSRAMTLANWLVSHDKVSTVNYCGLETHPDHVLAKSQQSAFGGVLSFEVKGGQAEAWAFINSTCLMSLTANLGDVKTTICHPASTTHGRLSDEQKQEAGITNSLIRIAVGLEDVSDIIADCERGFSAL